MIQTMLKVHCQAVRTDYHFITQEAAYVLIRACVCCSNFLLLHIMRQARKCSLYINNYSDTIKMKG